MRDAFQSWSFWSVRDQVLCECVQVVAWLASRLFAHAHCIRERARVVVAFVRVSCVGVCIGLVWRPSMPPQERGSLASEYS